MSGTNDAWLALDVGGANIKAVHSSGVASSTVFEVWKRPDGLSSAIARVASSMPKFDRVALTTTAELCDCYPTKRIGVLSILDAASSALAGRTVLVWGVDGELRAIEKRRDEPEPVAAANWLALATVAARMTEQEGSGLLVDVGSTTTDLIPFADGVVRALGRTDTERLRTGELIYAGVRRTPLFALADRLPFRGVATSLMAELFATTLDVFVTLGDIPEDTDDHSTADGRPATIEASRDRLARVVGADRDGFSGEDARRLVRSAREALLSRMMEGFHRGRLARPDFVIVSGSGEFLARELAGRLVGPKGLIFGLSDFWGADASGAACAAALLWIAENGGKAA